MLIDKNNVLILSDFNITDYAYFLQKGETNNKILALNNFMNVLNLSQRNSILNTLGRLLDLVIHNKTCLVERSVDPWVPEDEHRIHLVSYELKQ